MDVALGVLLGLAVAASAITDGDRGMVTGGLVASCAIVAGLLTGAESLSGPLDALPTQPAIVSVPVAFAAIIGVSLFFERPVGVGLEMLALHAPEGLGLEALGCARA
jgi:hypothetical protein